MDLAINDVVLTPLKQIPHPQGDIFHGMKSSDETFQGFGEAYFSFVKKGAKKGWKKHFRMTLNLVVPIGEIKFYIFDDRQDSSSKGKKIEISITPDGNYQRLTVPPGLWVAFEGQREQNMLLNLASMPHDPTESINKTEDELFS